MAVTTQRTGLPWSRPLTADDMAAMPDDGHRYELIDGTLVVTPAPMRRHQRLVGNLYLLLREACPPELEVLLAPYEVRLADDTAVQPDLLVARRADTTERNLPTAPLLVVEVASPSTRLVDLNLKKARYEAAGCPSYWVLDPETSSLIAWELRSGAYAVVAEVTGDDPFVATQPYPVTVVTSSLVG